MLINSENYICKIALNTNRKKRRGRPRMNNIKKILLIYGKSKIMHLAYLRRKIAKKTVDSKNKPISMEEIQNIEIDNLLDR
jgi:hypothetical protein